MTQTPEPSFQPLSMLPVFSKLIDEMLSAALENHKSLTKAAPTPSVLDDDTVSRVIKVFTEM